MRNSMEKKRQMVIDYEYEEHVDEHEFECKLFDKIENLEVELDGLRVTFVSSTPVD